MTSVHDNTCISCKRGLSFARAPSVLRPFSLRLFQFLRNIIKSHTTTRLRGGCCCTPSIHVRHRVVLASKRLYSLLGLFETRSRRSCVRSILVTHKPLRTPGRRKHRETQRLASSSFTRASSTTPNCIRITAPKRSESRAVTVFSNGPRFQFVTRCIGRNTSSNIHVASGYAVASQVIKRQNICLVDTRRGNAPASSRVEPIDKFFHYASDVLPTISTLVALYTSGIDSNIFVTRGS